MFEMEIFTNQNLNNCFMRKLSQFLEEGKRWEKGLSINDSRFSHPNGQLFNENFLI